MLNRFVFRLTMYQILKTTGYSGGHIRFIIR